MRLKISETVKDAFYAVFLVFVVATIVGRAGPTSVHVGNIVMAILCTVLGASYVVLRMVESSRRPTEALNRAPIFCGLMFAGGFLSGLSRALIDGWEWVDLAMIVPGLLACFCLRQAFGGRTTQSA